MRLCISLLVAAARQTREICIQIKMRQEINMQHQNPRLSSLFFALSIIFFASVGFTNDTRLIREQTFLLSEERVRFYGRWSLFSDCNLKIIHRCLNRPKSGKFSKSTYLNQLVETSVGSPAWPPCSEKLGRDAICKGQLQGEKFRMSGGWVSERVLGWDRG